MAIDLSSLKDQLTEWVYDRRADTSLGDVSLTPFADEHHLDPQEAFQLLRFCEEAGLLGSRYSTHDEACANLTRAGSAWVERRRRRREDPAARVAAARTGLLTWMWRRKHEGTRMPVVARVLEAPESLFEGLRLEASDIERSAAYLEAKGLIKGAGHAWGMTGPLRAEITAEGEDCVENYGADLAVHERRSIGGGTVTNYYGSTVVNGGMSGGIASTGDHNTINGGNGIDAQALASLVQGLRDVAPRLGLDDVDAGDFAVEVEALERDGGDAEQGARIWRRILRLAGPALTTAVASGVGTRLVELGAGLYS